MITQPFFNWIYFHLFFSVAVVVDVVVVVVVVAVVAAVAALHVWKLIYSGTELPLIGLSELDQMIAVNCLHHHYACSHPIGIGLQGN